MLGRGVTRVTVAGDSSGCGLVLSLLLSIKQQGLPMPGAAILFCPWVDLTATGPGHPPHELDDIRRASAGLYLAGHPGDDPLVNPLSADLTGLPPMLIQAATGDPLLGEARELTDHAQDCGVNARFELFPSTPTTSTSSGASSPKPPRPWRKPAASPATPRWPPRPVSSPTAIPFPF